MFIFKPLSSSKANNAFLFPLFLIVFINFNVSGQSYIGHTIDNYSGIHGVIYNSANIVSSNLRADINILSVSTLVDNDYFAIDIGEIISNPGEFDFDKNAAESPTNNNNFITNFDVVGPSFMFNIDKKSSIGLITRVRGIFNATNINGELFVSVLDGFEDNVDFPFDSPDLAGKLHVWGEIGLSYGRILMSKQNHMISGGVTIKYLRGAGGLYINTPGLQGFFDADQEQLTSQGFLNYGTTQGFDSDDISFSDTSGGFGADIGFVYEYHPNRGNDNIRYFQDPYKLKVGVSVTDIGSISYDNATLARYDMNRSISTSTWQEDLLQFLEDNYDAEKVGQTAKFQLPTAAHILVDYRVFDKFLISAQGDFSLTDANDALSNNMINNLTLTPRMETKWFSAYLPLSIRQYSGLAMGAGVRLGPLTIGSGSIITNLVSSESETADIFVGLKVPLYRR